MPGPLPKDPAVRQRRNKSSTKALLPAERFPRKRAPKLPALAEGQKWHAMAKQFWQDIWSSPMRHEYLRADEPALFRLVMLVNSFWTAEKIGTQLAIAKEIRALEREFGLTPLSRRRLEWAVAQAEEAVDRHEHKRANRAVIIDSDPRGVLDK